MKLVLSVSAIAEQTEGRCPSMWIDVVHGWRRGCSSELMSSGSPRRKMTT